MLLLPGFLAICCWQIWVPFSLITTFPWSTRNLSKLDLNRAWSRLGCCDEVIMEFGLVSSGCWLSGFGETDVYDCGDGELSDSCPLSSWQEVFCSSLIEMPKSLGQCCCFKPLILTLNFHHRSFGQGCTVNLIKLYSYSLKKIQCD